MSDDNKSLKALFARQSEIFKAGRRLYTQVGEVVVALSELETALLFLFVVAGRPVPDRQCEKIFVSQTSLEKKLQLVSFIIDHSCEENEKRRWHKIKSVVGQNKDIRNLAAHQNAWIDDDDPSGIIKVYLGPSPMMNEVRGRDINVDELERTAAALVKVRREVQELTMEVFKRKGLIEEIEDQS